MKTPQNEVVQEKAVSNSDEKSAEIGADEATNMSCYRQWKDQVENAKVWVESYVHGQNFTVRPNRTFLHNGQQVKSSDVLRGIKIQYDRDFKNCFNHAIDNEYPWPQRIATEILALALEEYVDRNWELFRKNKVEVLHHDPNLDLSELNRFIEACTGQVRDLDVMVLAHWIWQIKRKMTSQAVTNHIMPILIGHQGSGKSTAVEMLVSCISDYRVDMSISALADERNYHSLEECFVIVCDEMQGCDKTDVDRLKNMITASVTTARKLYTNTRDKIPQNASLIGTSNKMVELLIKDDTGLRRFHVISCAEKMTWDVLNSIDYLKIWKSINEDSHSGYITSVLSQLRVEQEANRVTTPVEDYLRETKAIPCHGAVKTVTVNDLFSDYCKWCEGAKSRPLDRGWFSKHLKQYGISLKRTSKHRLAEVSESFNPWTLLDALGALNDSDSSDR